MHFRGPIRGQFFWAALFFLSGCGLNDNGLQQSKSDASATDSGLEPSSDAASNAGTGGAVPIASGGTVGTGGSAGTSGARAGSGGAGMVVGTGGITGGAGSAQTGGRSGSGGGVGTGGTGAGGTGTGGMMGTGGRPGTGGVPASGGAPGTGGRMGTGGAMGVAGRAGMGGDAPMGGNAGAGGQPGGPAPCGPATCAHGCCNANNVCVTNQTRQACGTAGVACAPCGGCFQCGDTGTCELTRSSTWTVTCVGASVATTKTGGAAWDNVTATSASGAPDPFCEFQINEIGQRDTDALTDSFSPTWNQNITPRNMTLTANWLINQAGSWSILVGDYDGNNNDEICQIFPTLNAASFATGTLTYSNQRSCLNLTVQLTCNE